jgi:adenosylmethionine-8-amino-7-oxononanoate aminotransferase
MKSWEEKDREYIWHPFTPLEGALEPLFISSAQGSYLYTEDGRKIIDGISSWWVNLHGHSHPVIAKAIAHQASKLEHVIFAGFTHEPAIQLAENLLSILPPNFSKIFFSDNGSTAVEVAIKMAIQYWRNKNQVKNKIIAIQGAYHGDTFGAMSVGERGPFSDHFKNHLFEVEFIDWPSADKEEFVIRQYEKLVKDEQVAAFIFEPLVQAAGGMRMYSSQFLEKVLGLSEKYKVITIADEVFTGFGRTGKNFATDYLGQKPDLIALSKGITGGSLPLGVTACSKKIVDAFQSDEVAKTFFHGHSFTANPIACAAANASFSLLMKDECKEKISHIELSHKTFSTSLAGNKFVKEVRQIGTILAIELDTQTKTSYFNDIRKKIYSFFLERDILLRPLGNVIYFLPPYCIDDGDLKTVYEGIREFLNELNQSGE